MEWMKGSEKLKDILNKYKYVALVLLLGVILMLLPGSKDTEEMQEILDSSQQEYDISRELEIILSRIDGVGEVDVLVTESTGPETIYQTDEDKDSDSMQTNTVIISGTDRGEYGLVRQINAPVYFGALIVCEGADRPSVRLAVVEAVRGITGIPSDRISVLKMK